MLDEHSWAAAPPPHPKADPEPSAMKHQGLFPRPGRQDHPKDPTHHTDYSCHFQEHTHTHTQFTIWPGILYALSSMQISPAPLIAGMLMMLTARQGWLSRAVPALHHAALQPARCHGPTGLLPAFARQDSHALGCSQSLKCKGDNKKSWERIKRMEM